MHTSSVVHLPVAHDDPDAQLPVTSSTWNLPPRDHDSLVTTHSCVDWQLLPVGQPRVHSAG